MGQAASRNNAYAYLTGADVPEEVKSAVEEVKRACDRKVAYPNANTYTGGLTGMLSDNFRSLQAILVTDIQAGVNASDKFDLIIAAMVANAPARQILTSQKAQILAAVGAGYPNPLPAAQYASIGNAAINNLPGNYKALRMQMSKSLLNSELFAYLPSGTISVLENLCMVFIHDTNDTGADSNAVEPNAADLRLLANRIDIGGFNGRFVKNTLLYVANAVNIAAAAANLVNITTPAGAGNERTRLFSYISFIALVSQHNPATYLEAALNALGGSRRVQDTSVSYYPVHTGGLKYYQDGKWVAGTKNMKDGDVIYCAEIGKMRFDTKLVRNLTWLVQLQRIMRVVLIGHLSWINTPVVRGLKIADPKLTEFEGNDQYDDKDYTGEKYELL